jgi:hypothetical protein
MSHFSRREASFMARRTPFGIAVLAMRCIAVTTSVGQP